MKRRPLVLFFKIFSRNRLLNILVKKSFKEAVSRDDTDKYFKDLINMMYNVRTGCSTEDKSKPKCPESTSSAFEQSRYPDPQGKI
jgi:hypothetical protein